jgi:hypothetical protein
MGLELRLVPLKNRIAGPALQGFRLRVFSSNVSLCFVIPFKQFEGRYGRFQVAWLDVLSG